MSDTQSLGRSGKASMVVTQYYRRSRVLTYLVGITVVGSVGASFALLSFYEWLLCGITVFVIFQSPVFTTDGHIALVTNKAPEAVSKEFQSPMPPILPFHWGLADQIEATDDGGHYVIRYLLGLQSIEMTVKCQPAPNDPADVKLIVTVGDSSWGNYHVNIDTTDTTDNYMQTTVDITVETNRRFGLRRLPQQLIADKYRPTALEAQGYDIVSYDPDISLRSGYVTIFPNCVGEAGTFVHLVAITNQEQSRL
ncbi:hypothetical protein [Haloquadratum walsbyi]|uniref:Uncharacterized protein n=1 Tax=Haloquadratum walsbyi J07HQW2 TaxID=1238425 RepID=U1NGR1_9EURY|nr:hypothetical protein [Haloquadratum walsbyi]ERG96028.1 MAG: hypothetical protein J07HQW2_02495 [Haloquadratum walsbyi J07HQW2]